MSALRDYLLVQHTSDVVSATVLSPCSYIGNHTITGNSKVYLKSGKNSGRILLHRYKTKQNDL